MFIRCLHQNHRRFNSFRIESGRFSIRMIKNKSGDVTREFYSTSEILMPFSNKSTPAVSIHAPTKENERDERMNFINGF